MRRDRTDCSRLARACLRPPAPLGTAVTASLQLARAPFPRRVLRQRWIRYQIDLADTPAAPPHVRLTRVTDPIIGALRQRPDRAETSFKSGLRFWDEGLRRAYIWLGPDGPLCIQWLLLPGDNRPLRRLDGGAGVYPPLPRGRGQVGDLVGVSAGRRSSVTAGFGAGGFDQARPG